MVSPVISGALGHSRLSEFFQISFMSLLFSHLCYIGSSILYTPLKSVLAKLMILRDVVVIRVHQSATFIVITIA